MFYRYLKQIMKNRDARLLVYIVFFKAPSTDCDKTPLYQLSDMLMGILGIHASHNS